MKFTADLHIHSKYSRATSKNLDLENLYIAAQLKGITVVGTGDAIHPGWFSELKEKLIPSEQGLYRLRGDIADRCDEKIPLSCRAPVRFVLQTEISNIYKKKEVTRKNHNLIFLPDIETAEKLKERIENIGNIHSDGRPILGLDAKHLLEIVLEVSFDAFLIPAHIWTPWFSMLGSKSGFDSLEECFGDLSSHIFAVETGLSSDPAMNRLVSGLDGLTLVSNSDAHSPANLGREVNLFDTDLSYGGIRSALEKKSNNGFVGTIEFYPEEGKYHLDGHRKCRLRYHPQETASFKEKCPKCGKPLTLGVLNRVLALADRNAGEAPKDLFFNRVPLADILSDIFKTGKQSKKVQRAYQKLLTKFGNELKILNEIDVKELERSGNYLLSEAIHRMRAGRIRLSPGYDGEFGKIQIFSSGERSRLLGQRSMFDMSSRDQKKHQIFERKEINSEKATGATDKDKSDKNEKRTNKKEPPDPENNIVRLNRAQKEAVTHPSGPLLIVAGPGTGKTLTLTHRIAFLIDGKSMPPEKILAITFTNKAAVEMQKRLDKLLGKDSKKPLAATFHQFCFQLLKEKEAYQNFSIIEERDRRQLMALVVRKITPAGKKLTLKRDSLLTAISHAKQKMMDPEAYRKADISEKKMVSEAYFIYNEALRTQKLFDYEDLIYILTRELESNEAYRRKCRSRFQYVFVDEYQDLNYGQYRLVRALSPPDTNICVIGDPDQSIYGFRGSDYRYFINFIEDFPKTKSVFLERNYRSTRIILKAAYQVMNGRQLIFSTRKNDKRRVYSSIEGHHKNIHVLEMSNERAEADAVARTIEKMVGGSGYHTVDAGRVEISDMSRPMGFSDVAVLYRTGDQHRIITESLSRYGIPFQVAGRHGEGDSPVTRLLLSLFKVVDGSGHYSDFERVSATWEPGIGKETVFNFCQWGLTHGYDLASAMKEAKRFPIPGLSRLRQEKVVDFVKIMNGFSKQVSGMPFPDKLRYLLTHTRLERMIRESSDVSLACDRLLSRVEKNDLSAGVFFSQKALETETDTISLNVQKVTLMTLHAAKGLEFPVVFIVGCEDDLIPLRRSEGDECMEDEERRLFFVAMTRAKEQLFITWARRRKRFGKTLSRQPSPFVSAISEDLLVRQEPVYGNKRRQVQTQMKFF